ncbi:hypothetical protein [Sandarakinorhabdus sp. DWP1-3-1]|uniref:hypothetical protein n=1 Tax=Sandarakinorhabdus sp. DWP1-3-1 TaxID=2804627 RepID=UPI003CFB08CB
MRYWMMLPVLAAPPAAAWEPVALPAAVRAALPLGHVARVVTCSRTLDPPRAICVVVAARLDEGNRNSTNEAPQRPLLVYRLNGITATLIARNDKVVLRRDEGGQCDPVEDAGALTVKERFFTLEQGVACGQHWTDYTTFRFDPRTQSFVWQNRIYESWRMNDDTRPDAEALVSDGRRVWRANLQRPVTLANYAPR